MLELLPAAALVVGGGLVVWRRYFVLPLAHISTGQQRRALFPASKGIGPGAEACLAAKDVAIRRELHTLRSGEQIFYQLVAPTDRAPTHICVFFHGYTSHGDLYLEAMCEVARQGALVVLPDLPCHGRSDGLLTYMPDWFAWVEQIWEFLEAVVTPLRADGERPRRVFAAGMSLGGGLVACLGVQRPTFFDGLVLICPMLFVAEEIKPPVIVQQLFKTLLGPFRLTWPVTPSKGTDEFDFRVPEQGARFGVANPLSMRGLKPRLATAKELGFTFPEWMEDRLCQVRTPFLAMHGSADKVTDPELSKRLHREAAAADKELKLYDGAFHCELFCCFPGNARLISLDFLPEQEALTARCLKDMCEWVAARV